MAGTRRYFYDVSSLQRRYPEGEKRRERREFERDLSRLKHSFSLRRLAGVTQVFQSDGRRTVRNRYSHSIEVADIAAAIAAQLGPDPDVVSAAALAHDLGHPPFGHHGEHVLNQFAHSIGLDGYEGNAQTLSILTRLEPKIFIDGTYHGLNPTRAFVDASIKYPWLHGQHAGSKFGVYRHDFTYFHWIRAGAPLMIEKSTVDKNFTPPICVEAQVMDWADDVAYCTHDVEDGILAGFIDIAQLADSAERRALCEFATNHPDVDYDAAYAAHDRIMALPEMERLRRLPQVGIAREAPALIKELTGTLIDRFVDQAVAATWQRFGGQPIGRYDGALIVPSDVRAEAEVLKAITWRHVIDSPRFQRQRAREVEILDTVTRRLMHIHDTIVNGSEQMDSLFRSGTDPLFALLWALALEKRDEAIRYRGIIDAVGALTDQGLITLAQRLP